MRVARGPSAARKASASARMVGTRYLPVPTGAHRARSAKRGRHEGQICVERRRTGSKREEVVRLSPHTEKTRPQPISSTATRRAAQAGESVAILHAWNLSNCTACCFRSGTARGRGRVDAEKETQYQGKKRYSPHAPPHFPSPPPRLVLVVNVLRVVKHVDVRPGRPLAVQARGVVGGEGGAQTRGRAAGRGRGGGARRRVQRVCLHLLGCDACFRRVSLECPLHLLDQTLPSGGSASEIVPYTRIVLWAARSEISPETESQAAPATARAGRAPRTATFSHGRM